LNLQSNDFELFRVPERFAQDPGALDLRWKALQREVHPDRFAAQGSAAQRIAMQWSARINEAYRRLKDPLRRAAYLCELRGAPIEAENNTAMPAQFLMEQMAWREALEDATTRSEIDGLSRKLRAKRVEAIARLALLLDEQPDAAAAAQQVRELMFVERFSQDVHARSDQLDEAQEGQ
jgi:molecular chaperone HscB